MSKWWMVILYTYYICELSDAIILLIWCVCMPKHFAERLCGGGRVGVLAIWYRTLALSNECQWENRPGQLG